MTRTRFLTKIREELSSTTGTVIWGHNRLNQRRQFAFDGVQWFYQPDKRSPFVPVNGDDVPKPVKDAMDHARAS